MRTGVLADRELNVGVGAELKAGGEKVERGLLPPLGSHAVKDERDGGTLITHDAVSSSIHQNRSTGLCPPSVRFDLASTPKDNGKAPRSR